MTFLRVFLCAVAALLWQPWPASAAPMEFKVVSACSGQSYAVGASGQATGLATGELCGVSASGSGNIGNVGGKTVSVCVTPTVTSANAYGVNYVVGGLLTFSGAFTATGSGILQGVQVNVAKVETSGFTFIPFNSNPSSTTWTDAAAAAINAADVTKVRGPVPLSAYSGLGTHTAAYASGLGAPLTPGATTLYGVLIANAALTNNFGSTSDVQVCVTILQDL